MIGLKIAVATTVVFATYVIGAFAATRPRAGAPDRFRISLFLIYCLGISAAVGFTRRPLYPFHHWTLIAGVMPDTVFFARLIAVDSAGAEQEVDFRAWEPMEVSDLHLWAFSPTGFMGLDSTARIRTARYLIEHAETARREAQAGHRFGTYARYLGPLTAPSFVIGEPIWKPRGSVPPAPFVGLRWVIESWRPRARERSAGILGRRVTYQVMIEP